MAAIGPDEPSDRASAQRERVLCAAEACFLRSGFHSASVATIAATAGMSAGLIYRYFENKNAIVMAIIERQLADAESMVDGLHSQADVRELFLTVYDRWHEGGEHGSRAALFLEIAAEASRDPGIGRTLRAADAALRQRLRDVLARQLGVGGDHGLDPAQRTTVLQLLLEGLAVRTIREPGLTREALGGLVDILLPRLLGRG